MGYVYRGSAIPQLRNLLIFGDNPSGEIFYVNADKLPQGGQDPIRRILFTDGGSGKTLLELIRDRQAHLGPGRSSSSGKSSKGAALVTVDIDYFRRLLRKLGNTASQKLATAAAERLQSADESLTWFALGIDRFAAVTDHKSDKEAAAWAADWLLDLFRKEFTWGQEKIQLSASAGIVELTADQTPQKILDKALAALQLAKASGRGSVATSHEVDEDQETWAQLAAGGNLFATTRARDVMIPCSTLLSVDDTHDQAQALFDQSRLTAISESLERLAQRAP